MKGNYFILGFIAILKLAQCEITTTKKLHELMNAEERREFFHIQDDKPPQYSIINLKWPTRGKRSGDTIPFSIPTFDKNINLNLGQPKDMVFGPNFALYTITTMNARQIHCAKTLPLANMAHYIYQDQNNLATLLVSDDETGEMRIKRAIIGSQNITMEPVPEKYFDELGLNSNETYYVVKKSAGFLETLPKIVTKDALARPKRYIDGTVPSVIYPEILVLLDSHSAEIIKRHEPHDGNHLLSYMLTFWSQVQLYYASLENPKYKLSLAGLVTGDASSLSFVQRNVANSLITGEEKLLYANALNTMGSWLYRSRNCIPLDSYDIAVHQTLYNSYNNIWEFLTQSPKLGIAQLGEACGVSHNQNLVSKVSIVNDDGNFGGLQTAAHELGHSLGAPHDIDQRCQNLRNIMMPSTSPPGITQNIWSACSLRGFSQFLTRNPTCLYNVPEQYQIRQRPVSNNGDIGFPTIPKPAANPTNPFSNNNGLNGQINVPSNKPYFSTQLPTFYVDPLQIPANKLIQISRDGTTINLYLADR